MLQTQATAQEGSSSVLACVCDLGYAAEELTTYQTVSSITFTHQCSACIPGTFKDHRDLELCSYCGVYIDGQGGTYLHTYGDSTEYGATSIHHCQACPPNSGQNHLLIGVDGLVMQDVESCKCFMGYENRSEIAGCKNCSNYQVQPEYSDNACEFCPEGHYFVASYLACIPCHIADEAGNADADHELHVLNSIDPSLTWGTSAADCVCSAGHERLSESTLCSKCNKGHVRPDLTTRHCEACGVDTFQNVTGQLLCHQCPAASSTLGKSAVMMCMIVFVVLVMKICRLLMEMQFVSFVLLAHSKAIARALANLTVVNPV